MNLAALSLTCSEDPAHPLQYVEIEAAEPLAPGAYNVSFDLSDYTAGAWQVVLAGTTATPVAASDGSYGFTVTVSTVTNNKIKILARATPGGTLNNLTVDPA